MNIVLSKEDPSSYDALYAATKSYLPLDVTNIRAVILSHVPAGNFRGPFSRNIQSVPTPAGHGSLHLVYFFYLH